MFNIGENVKVLNSNIYGVIISMTNNHYFIKSNGKILKIKKDFVEKYDASKIAINTNKYKERNIYLHLSKKEVSNEIMLRHQTVEEAIYNLDKFIDTALINKFDHIKIIHGKNGGILRNAVHEYLKNSPYIKSYRLGGYFEGQFGVTIAELR